MNTLYKYFVFIIILFIGCSENDKDDGRIPTMADLNGRGRSTLIHGGFDEQSLLDAYKDAIAESAIPGTDGQRP